MSQKIRSFVGLFAILIFAGAFAPIAANAGPIGNLLHPYFAARQAKDATLQIKLYNKGQDLQSVKIDDVVYKVAPHNTVVVKAAVGTKVYAASAGKGFAEGDVLFSVTSNMKGVTVSFN